MDSTTLTQGLSDGLQAMSEGQGYAYTGYSPWTSIYRLLLRHLHYIGEIEPSVDIRDFIITVFAVSHKIFGGTFLADVVAGELMALWQDPDNDVTSRDEVLAYAIGRQMKKLIGVIRSVDVPLSHFQERDFATYVVCFEACLAGIVCWPTLYPRRIIQLLLRGSLGSGILYKEAHDKHSTLWFGIQSFYQNK